MKTAIYIQDGLVQLVITPESKFEKAAMSSFDNDNIKAAILRGSFYETRGGWTRNGLNSGGDVSLILRIVPEFHEEPLPMQD